MYEAKTRLYVSTTAGGSASDVYQGTLTSQQRVISYTELLMGQNLAQRTVDKLGLDIPATKLREHVDATAKTDTVLIDLSVKDISPVRARDLADTMSDEFVAMVRELETPEDGTAPSARVIVEQHASIPDGPVSPKKTRNLSIGVVLGLLLGVGVAVLRDLLNNTVKDRQTVESIAGVGLVGSIPLDKDRRKEPAIRFDTENSPIAEAFRKIRTNLQFLAVDNPPHVILVTSPAPNEGKSTTSLNIALALAQNGHTVVLVDGDLRRPTLAKYLNLVESVGLSTVLAGRAPLLDSLQESRFHGVTVLTSGPLPPNPSELLGTLAAKRVLSELRSLFDYVIVDSCPLLAVTDAAILAADVDGVLLVARYGETKRDQLAHAVKNLEDVGASPLGAILTMTPTRGSTSYNYGYGDYKTASVQPFVAKDQHRAP